ncbi:MAG: hypothetical protein V1897_14810 [Pseudomonadota bacterium]
MSLNDKLSRRREVNRKLVPQDKLKVMDAAQERLAQSGIVDACLREGDIAPKFELPNATGQVVSLEKLLRNGPVVLSFYRGGW